MKMNDIRKRFTKGHLPLIDTSIPFVKYNLVIEGKVVEFPWGHGRLIQTHLSMYKVGAGTPCRVEAWGGWVSR